ncbi:MAG: hypothetical protein ABGW84_13235 [Sphingomonadaceae bacterium]
MSEEPDHPLSPTVAKILDQYLAVLEKDENLDAEAAKRLDNILRQGKIPKFEDIDKALSGTKSADVA